MARLLRDVAAAERVAYDLVIVGGGIYGAMTLLEATRRGLRALLVEEHDFGSGTTFNNLRIVHGGLRYLQSADLGRFRESVAERRWFLKHFPELVQPLPCIMPLYGGLKRNRALLRAALAVNDLLSRRRNVGIAPGNELPDGRVLSPADTVARFPAVRREGLAGAALWYDAAMPDCHRLLIETLRWAASAGGAALNYVSARGLIVADGQVVGVRASDGIDGRDLEFRTSVVVNAAGPAVDRVLGRFGVQAPPLYRASLAWNVLLDRAPLAGDAAVAVEPPGPGSQVWFAHALGGRLFAGTGHAARPPDCDGVEVTAPELDGMLDSMNRAVPGLRLTPDDIIGVFAGQLPVSRARTTALSSEASIVDHEHAGGPRGLMSVSGVKFTTSRSTAARLLGSILERFPQRAADRDAAYPPRPANAKFQIDDRNAIGFPGHTELLRLLVLDEAPQTLADLLLRRATVPGTPRGALKFAAAGCAAFGWNDQRCAGETERLRTETNTRFIVKKDR